MSNSDQSKRQVANAHTLIVSGMLGLTITGIFLTYCYAFASLIDPEIRGIERFWAVIRRLFAIPSPGIATIPAAVVFLIASYAILRGLVICVSVFFKRRV